MSNLGSSLNSSSSPLSSSTFSASPSSSNSSSSTNQNSRCEGLDLLLKAVLHLKEPVFFGVPFTQKKVIRRRKRALRFKKTLKPKTDKDNDKKLTKIKKETRIEVISNPEREKRLKALPSKYQDSVLQPWKRRTRQTK